MAQKKFRLSARLNSDNPSGIRPILKRLISGKGTMKSIENGFEVEADLEGESARALNRMLLSELRRAEKRTRIRANGRRATPWKSSSIMCQRELVG